MSSDRREKLTWYYKPIDMLVINFAVIASDIPDVIRLIDQAGK